MQKYYTSKHPTALLTICFSKTKLKHSHYDENYFTHNCIQRLCYFYTYIDVHSYWYVYIYHMCTIPTSRSNVWCYSIGTNTLERLCIRVDLQNGCIIYRFEMLKEWTIFDIAIKQKLSFVMDSIIIERKWKIDSLVTVMCAGGQFNNRS